VSRLSIIELHTDELKFSAGHFMLYSATKRETMHGHDYQVSIAIHTLIERNGMSFDCRDYKDTLATLCQKLDYRFLLPSQSEFLTLEETSDAWIAHIGQEKLSFLKNDAVVLPICNITLEELSHWFLLHFTQSSNKLASDNIQGITVKVYNGRGESGASSWGTVS
jgi:6-pyruvoyltetrahydropterin/6-carboxytetrahydropterin synthase